MIKAFLEDMDMSVDESEYSSEKLTILFLTKLNTRLFFYFNDDKDYSIRTKGKGFNEHYLSTIQILNSSGSAHFLWNKQFFDISKKNGHVFKQLKTKLASVRTTVILLTEEVVEKISNVVNIFYNVRSSLLIDKEISSTVYNLKRIKLLKNPQAKRIYKLTSEDTYLEMLRKITRQKFLSKMTEVLNPINMRQINKFDEGGLETLLNLTMNIFYEEKEEEEDPKKAPGYINYFYNVSLHTKLSENYKIVV